MSKTNTNISIDSEIKEKLKQKGVNISQVCEHALKNLYEQLYNQDQPSWFNRVSQDDYIFYTRATDEVKELWRAKLRKYVGPFDVETLMEFLKNKYVSPVIKS